MEKRTEMRLIVIEQDVFFVFSANKRRNDQENKEDTQHLKNIPCSYHKIYTKVIEWFSGRWMLSLKLC